MHHCHQGKPEHACACCSGMNSPGFAQGTSDWKTHRDVDDRRVRQSHEQSLSTGILDITQANRGAQLNASQVPRSCEKVSELKSHAATQHRSDWKGQKEVKTVQVFGRKALYTPLVESRVKQTAQCSLSPRSGCTVFNGTSRVQTSIADSGPKI
jgi:hypothetical protein